MSMSEYAVLAVHVCIRQPVAEIGVVFRFPAIQSLRHIFSAIRRKPMIRLYANKFNFESRKCVSNDLSALRD